MFDYKNNNNNKSHNCDFDLEDSNPISPHGIPPHDAAPPTQAWLYTKD